MASITTPPTPWHAIDNIADLASPALLVFPERAEENLRRTIALAGGTERLRLHVKTHKMAEIVQRCLTLGISKFKCSTIAEAEMVARAGAPDILLAFPQVGPGAERLARLAAGFRHVRWSTIADDAQLLARLSAAACAQQATLEILLDIDNGMHRSGIEPGQAAFELYRLLASLPGIQPGGLHVYDGHLRDRDLAARAQNVRRAMEPVDELRRRLLAAGLNVPRVVVGGSASFPVHCRRDDLECSPGTCVFWDINYATKFPELNFQFAALLLARVISKPGPRRLCLDLGYKAVSPDNPHPRVEFLDLPTFEVVNHSEEHLAIETDQAQRFRVGDALLGVPWHVCPTVALHQEAVIVEKGRAVGRWQVAARDRRLTY